MSRTSLHSGAPKRQRYTLGPSTPGGTARWKVILFLAGLATVALALLLRPVIRNHLATNTGVTLQAAQEALDAGDAHRALELAQSALMKATKSHRPVAPCLMMLGLVREQQAERASSADRLVYFAAAAQHFAEAAKSGLPLDEQARLSFHLGKCQHARGQYSESIRLLKQSLSSYPAGKPEALHLLTLAYLDPNQLDAEKAYESNLELILTPGVSKDARAQAWKTRRELLDRLGRSDPLADIDLEQVSTDTKWVSPLLRACELFQEKQFDAVMACLTPMLKVKGLPQPIERRAWYLMALSAKEKGDVDAALAMFRQQLEWRYPNTPEARAAATQSGAILLAQGKVEQAIALLRRAAQMAAGAEEPRLLPLGGPSLGRVLASAIDRLRDQEHFETGAELLESYRQVVPAITADRTAAQYYEAWAAALLQQAKNFTSLETAQASYRAEELWRMAGNYLVRVADATESSEEAPSLLWRAANDFVQGKGQLLAIGILDRLLASGVEGEMRVEALALTCAALEACGKPELVSEVAETCIRESPDHPATCKARYHLARCQIGFGETEQAETTLRAILATATSEADPAILQQTRLILAHILHDQGREEEAIRPLNEVIAEPADSEGSIEARMLLSDCLRQRARSPAGRLAESHSPKAKLHYRQRKDDDLDRALNILSALQRELAALERSDQLTTQQADWLRVCRCGIADCLFESDRVEEAIEMYKRLAETYTAPSDWLDAQIQIANCHVRMNRIDTARSVLRAAQQRLRQSPESIEEARVGMSPERWKEWVEWVRQL